MIIVAVCDEGYLGEMKYLLMSCARQMPTCPFSLYMVSERPKSHFAWLEQLHPKLKIELWPNPYPDAPHGPEQKKRLTICVRAKAIQHTLETHPLARGVVYMDGDMIVRNEMTDLFALLEQTDLSVLYRPQVVQRGIAGSPHAGTFNVGLIAVSKNKGGRILAEQYNQMLQEHIDLGRDIFVYREEYGINIGIDQEMLYLAYEQVASQINFTPLAHIYNDPNFLPDSVVWHGKGGARQNIMYRLEKRRYDWPILYYPLGWISKALNLYRQLRDKYIR